MCESSEDRSRGPFQREYVEVRIDRIVPGGVGIGFADGLTFFVPLTAPGDIVLARVTRRKGKIAWAEVAGLIVSGPDRIEPPCSHYGDCGGCDLQHLSYEAQLKAKKDIVLDCLRRIGGIEMPEFAVMVPSPLDFGYRTRVRWHIDAGRNAAGFKRRNSAEVIAVDHCPIVSDRLNSALADIVKSASVLPDEVEASEDDEGRVGFWPEIRIEDAVLSRTVAGEVLTYSAECFFQANASMLEHLAKAATGGLAGEMALDLYCGVGLFTLPLARTCRRVDAVETGRASAKFAEANLVRAGISNARIHRKDAGLFCRETGLDKYDTVVLDPPRSGPQQGVIANLAASKVRRISYVSCEPSILARDLRSLTAAGFGITELTMLDLFPQTHHIETVVRLVR